MGTLKTTLKVESTDLFPTPVSFTTVRNNAIALGTSSFATVTITGGTPVTVATIGAASAGGYLYLASPSTNTENIIITESGGGAVIMELVPGDIGFVPVGDNAGAGNTYDADTGSGANSATLNFYFGTR